MPLQLPSTLLQSGQLHTAQRVDACIGGDLFTSMTLVEWLVAKYIAPTIVKSLLVMLHCFPLAQAVEFGWLVVGSLECRPDFFLVFVSRWLLLFYS